MLEWDQDTVHWKAPQKKSFRGAVRQFSGLDFIAQLTLYIPPPTAIDFVAMECIPPAAAKPW